MPWNKEAAIERVRNDTLLTQIIQMEPRIQQIIDAAINQEPHPGYNRVRTYTNLKRQASSLVGDEADNPQLATSKHYDAVIEAIHQLLPSDQADGEDESPAYEDEDE